MKQRRRGLWLAMIKQMLKTSEKETSKLFNVCGIKWIILEESNLPKLFRRKAKQQTDKKVHEKSKKKTFEFLYSNVNTIYALFIGLEIFYNPFVLCPESWLFKTKTVKLFSPKDKLFCYCQVQVQAPGTTNKPESPTKVPKK